MNYILAWQSVLRCEGACVVAKVVGSETGGRSHNELVLEEVKRAVHDFRVDSLVLLTISVRLAGNGNSSPRAFLFMRRGLAATSGSARMQIHAAVACEVVFIIIAVCSAVRGTRFNDCPARLAGMTLYGGEKVVKGVKKLPSNRRVHS